MPSLRLPDGNSLDVAHGAAVRDAIASVHSGLLKRAVAARLNGELVDLATPIEADAELLVLTDRDRDALEILRHTAAHVMAMAVRRLFPDAKLAIGPVIENGFYYDFDLPRPLVAEDLAAIEKEMRAIVEENLEIRRIERNRAEALEEAHKSGQTYKEEIIRDVEGDLFSSYTMGDFSDLCRGPHVSSTGDVKHFKLLSHSAAYWRGIETNPVLQRIYGTAFFKKSHLHDHLAAVEQAKKRDHRKLGKELDLFSFHEEGPGFPFYHPNGTIVYNQLLAFSRAEHAKRGYQEIMTQMMLSEDLWHRSGHWDNYKENMYFSEVGGRSYAVKPMNCPGGTFVYRSKLRSYRDLPLRMSELGTVHRYEKSGVMHGLFRARAFVQDDAHIYCTPEQTEEEIVAVIDLVRYIYGAFGFKGLRVMLSTRPEKSIGSDQMWEDATGALKAALETAGLEYKINPGEGVFYGPKIEFHIKDSLGRLWQCGTIQVDFNMPERFELEYVDKAGGRSRPVMIHRAIYGSVERFFGILIEHYAGAFPVWLAPLQAVVLSITERHEDYAGKVRDALGDAGVRVEIDVRNEKIGHKIREHAVMKVPYLLIVGDEEEKDNSVAVRQRGEGDIGKMSIDKFRERIVREIERKT